MFLFFFSNIHDYGIAAKIFQQQEWRSYGSLVEFGLVNFIYSFTHKNIYEPTEKNSLIIVKINSLQSIRRKQVKHLKPLMMQGIWN